MDNNVKVVTIPNKKKEKPPKKPRSCPWNIGCKVWCKKYFWEGQELSSDKVIQVDPNAPWAERFLARFRRPIAILIPMSVYHFCWWNVMIKYNLWHIFKTKYFMSLVMILGGLVAGMTTEGGGAVAFPAMTLAFSINTRIARDFSLLIQASGMSAASFAIIFMGVRIEWYAIFFCSMGGLFGSLLGLEFVDPLLTPAQKKMGFVSIWFAFACSLLWLNNKQKRHTYVKIPQMKIWKMAALFIGGFIGGLFTSFAGTGLDICSFSVMTLLFRISEKIATPTAVCIMAWNSIISVFWRHVIMDGIDTETWEFLAVTFEVVTILAPLGATLGSHFHRQVLATFVYILDFVALITAFAIVPQTAVLASASVATIIVSLLIFYALQRIGQRIMARIQAEEEEKRILEEEEKVGFSIIPMETSYTVANGGYVHDGSIYTVEKTPTSKRDSQMSIINSSRI